MQMTSCNSVWTRGLAFSALVLLPLTACKGRINTGTSEPERDFDHDANRSESVEDEDQDADRDPGVPGEKEEYFFAEDARDGRDETAIMEETSQAEESSPDRDEPEPGDDGGEGKIWKVGPGRSYKTPCEVSNLAADGDVVEIDAGVYSGDVCRWSQNDITLRGIGGYAHLDANGRNYGGKAIWVIKGDNVTVEWIEFSKATVPDRNGAGIRQEGNNLTVRHCYFHDNENGILGGGNSDSTVTIEHTEFARNGYGDGYSHNLYIGRIKRLVFRFNYSHHARIGHNLKSRASENIIEYNRIMDEADGTSSYSVDLPNGGLAILVGNLIQQGPNTDNSTIVSYGAEGLVHPVNELYMSNNTLVNDRSAGTFVRVAGGTSAARLVNNLFVGPGTKVAGSAEQVTNLATDGSALVDRAGFDYHLADGSPAIDAGQAPGTARGFDLTPVRQYLHPADSEPRPSNGPIDIGAYEKP